MSPPQELYKPAPPTLSVSNSKTRYLLQVYILWGSDLVGTQCFAWKLRLRVLADGCLCTSGFLYCRWFSLLLLITLLLPTYFTVFIFVTAVSVF